MTSSRSLALYGQGLPAGLVVPNEYWSLLDEYNLEELGRWQFEAQERLAWMYRGLKQQYPERVYVPFATRVDQDEVACWTLPSPKIVQIHDYTDPGWERPRYYADFRSFMRSVVDDIFDTWLDIGSGSSTFPMEDVTIEPDLLYASGDLPLGFVVPDAYIAFDDLEMASVGQWTLEPRVRLREIFRDLRSVNPGRWLMPFAWRSGGDNAVCWTYPNVGVEEVAGIKTGEVATVSWYPDERAWMHKVVEEMLDSRPKGDGR